MNYIVISVVEEENMRWDHCRMKGEKYERERQCDHNPAPQTVLNKRIQGSGQNWKPQDLLYKHAALNSYVKK